MGPGVYPVKFVVALHSPSMSQLAAKLCEALESGLSPRKARVLIYSTPTLDPRPPNLRDAEYWVNNMVKLEFRTPAVNAAADDNYKVFVEVSSHSIVTESIKEGLW